MKPTGKGFTNAERAAFLHGKLVLWKDDGKWLRGVVVGVVHQDKTRHDYIEVRNTDRTTRNVKLGETTRAYPGYVKKA